MLRRLSLRLLPLVLLGGVLVSTRGLAEEPSKKPAEPPGGAAPAQAADDEVVLASGKGLRLTVADVQAELRQQPGRARVIANDPEALRQFAEQMVRMELMAREAERRGYGEHPAVVQAVKEEAVQELHRTLVDGQITPASISVEEIAAYYKENESRFKQPETRRARHILVETLQEAKALLPEAREANDRAFQQLAREHSIDTETKQRGGDLRFFAREDDPRRREAPVHPALRKAAFGLSKVGDTVKSPVEVDGRYSILRLTGIRKARETTLAQAEPSIRTRLWRRKRKEALAALMKRLHAELKPKVYAERIEAIDLTDVNTRPTGFAPDPSPKRREQARKAADLEEPEDEP